MTTIQTRRLRLRELGADDLDEMAAMLGDPTVMMHYPAPKTRAEAAAWIEWNLANYAEHGFGLWAVETHEREFIGDCGLTWQRVNGAPHLELGYHVKSSAQGQGYATEAALACRDHARSHGLGKQLVSVIHRENTPSQRVAEKVGMRLDTSLRHESPVHIVFAMDLGSDDVSVCGIG
ncbi:GNAT family N-acetyltransferase [Brevibacterium sp. GP-SGM9]|uniref:GNAT family N-acetyltransferase n=1 Tax=Brevibacterium sp. GP-SGM9 TaxID=3376990 RepID=UPI0039A60D04